MFCLQSPEIFYGIYTEHRFIYSLCKLNFLEKLLVIAKPKTVEESFEDEKNFNKSMFQILLL